MNGDIRTVAWKEWKSLFRQRENKLKALLTLLMPIAVFAVYVPWDAGEHWTSGGASIYAAIAIPILTVLLTVADSFAGERERHTLATLLASRLPDRAILFGKAAFSIGLAMAMTLVILATALLTVNFAHWDGALLLYTPKIVLIDLGLSFLFAALATGAGVLLSLRSASVQEAQQTLAAALLLPPAILGPILLLISRARPELRPRVLLGHLGETGGLMIFFGLLLLLALALFALAMARFQRAKLILR